MKTIVVNNPAARSSGALTILLEFLDKISTLKCERKFICFVSLEELKKYESNKIKIILINNQSFKKRIIWDSYGLKSYLKEKKITPDLFISLQNTPVNLNNNIEQILYFHQGLSIVNYNWSFFKKQERKLWIYQNIYPFFIKNYLNKVNKVIVQTNWVKENFSKKFNYNKDKIFIIKPKIKSLDTEKIKIIKSNKIRVFYPATPYIYKNHKYILEFLKYIYDNKKEYLDKIEVIFTFSESENISLMNLAKQYKIRSTIKFVGNLEYQKLVSYYKNSDVLIFPSLIETCGLPLIEIQQFKKEIFVIEKDYSIELLKDYPNKKFFKGNYEKEDFCKFLSIIEEHILGKIKNEIKG